MSSDIFWKPVKPIEGNQLPRTLKYVISPRFFNHDGTLGGSNVILNESHLEYLCGLLDCKVDGALELIDAIKRHGSVELYFD